MGLGVSVYTYLGYEFSIDVFFEAPGLVVPVSCQHACAVGSSFCPNCGRAVKTKLAYRAREHTVKILGLSPIEKEDLLSLRGWEELADLRFGRDRSASLSSGTRRASRRLWFSASNCRASMRACAGEDETLCSHSTAPTFLRPLPATCARSRANIGDRRTGRKSRPHGACLSSLT